MDKYITTGDKTLTRVVIEQWDRRYIAESPYSDTRTPEELLRLVTAALVASSWSEESIASAMHQFANDLVSEQWLPEDPAPATDEIQRWCDRNGIPHRYRIVPIEDEPDEDFICGEVKTVDGKTSIVPIDDLGHSEGQNTPAGEAVTAFKDPDLDKLVGGCPYNCSEHSAPGCYCQHDCVDEEGNHYCSKPKPICIDETTDSSDLNRRADMYYKQEDIVTADKENPQCVLDELAKHKINPHRFADPDYNKLIEEKEMQESHEAADPIFVSSSTSPVNLSEYCEGLKKQKIEG